MHTTCFDQHRSSSGVSKIVTGIALPFLPVTISKAVDLIVYKIEVTSKTSKVTILVTSPHHLLIFLSGLVARRPDFVSA
jgi:hypothetical protein